MIDAENEAKKLKIPCVDSGKGSHNIGDCWRCRHNFEVREALQQAEARGRYEMAKVRKEDIEKEVADEFKHEIKLAEQRVRDETVDEFNHLNVKAHKQGLLRGAEIAENRVIMSGEPHIPDDYPKLIAEAIRNEANK